MMIEFKMTGLLNTPPERIIDYISGYCRGVNRYGDIIAAVICKAEGIEIKNEILLFEDDNFIFNNDWWEGGDVVLVGFCYVDDIPIYIIQDV